MVPLENKKTRQFGKRTVVFGGLDAGGCETKSSHILSFDNRPGLLAPESFVIYQTTEFRKQSASHDSIFGKWGLTFISKKWRWGTISVSHLLTPNHSSRRLRAEHSCTNIEQWSHHYYYHIISGTMKLFGKSLAVRSGAVEVTRWQGFCFVA
jgi:hypothetical protein